MSTVGEFLRRMRDRRQPEPGRELGRRRRRTPGLRREEVAERAGVSIDWYVRLEQDRAARPSGEVLEAIAQALALTPAERRYLFRIARREEPTPAPLAAAAPHPSLVAALAALTTQPAMILGPRADVLAANARCEALFGGFGGSGRFGRNTAWFTLCAPAAPALFPDHALVARDVVGWLRASFARRPGDPAFAELLAELAARSPLFAALWSEQHVHEKGLAHKRFAHEVGLLDLAVHVLAAPDAEGQSLIFYEPRDAASRAALARLPLATRRPSGSPPCRARGPAPPPPPPHPPRR